MARLNCCLKLCKMLSEKNYLSIYCYFEKSLPHHHLSYGNDVFIHR
jgi:hypothetical protein